MKIETATIERLRDALLQSGRRPSPVMTDAYEVLTRQGLLSQEEMTALSRIDALGETMYLVMSSDGKITPEEQDALRGAIRGLTGDVLRGGTIKVMLETYESRLHEQGRDARLVEIANELADEPTEADGAFALAAAIALADNKVAEEETAFIEQLANWFNIDTERATRILDELDDDTPKGS